MDTQKEITEGSDGSKSASFVMLALSLLQGYGLSMMLGMMNALQIIICLPLFETSMPANSGMFNNIVTSMAVYEVIEIGDFANELLELNPTDPVNEKYESIGFGDLYFTNNVGCFVLTILFSSLLVIFWIFLYSLSRLGYSCVKRLRNNVADQLFWNKISGLIFESFLNVVLSSLIALKYNLEVKDYGQKVQTFMAVGTLCAFTIIPVALLCYLCYKFEEAGKKRTIKKFGSIYGDLNLKKGRKVLLVPAVFLIRRLWLALLLVDGTKSLVF